MRLRLANHRLPKSSAIALIVIAMQAVCGATAFAATAEIEGVWSFNGGSIVIQGLSDGSFQGTVVTPTTFAECPHPAGEVLWTNIRPRKDGSYWGYHQWFLGAKCEVARELGLTAWRTLETNSGERYLRVCFSQPGSNSQPTIAPDGSHANTTYGCSDSAHIAPVPVVSSNEGSGKSPGQITFAGTVLLPSAKACLKQSSLKIKLRDPKYDPLKTLLVEINGRKVLVLRGVARLRRQIVLTHLPKGTFKVTVVATTVLNQRLRGSRTYHSCRKANSIKLHGHKPRGHKHR